MVPTLGIVGTVIVLIMLILTVVSYAMLRDPSLNVLFYTLMVGLSIGFFMCLIRISSILSSQKTKDVLNPSMITFTSCPNYWVKTVDPISKNVTCKNQVAGSKLYVGVNDPISGGAATNVERSLDLTMLNARSNDDKCIAARSYPWSEAYIKC